MARATQILHRDRERKVPTHVERNKDTKSKQKRTIIATSVAIPPAMLDRIDVFTYQKGFSTRTQAMLHLLTVVLDQFNVPDTLESNKILTEAISDKDKGIKAPKRYVSMKGTK